MSVPFRMQNISAISAQGRRGPGRRPRQPAKVLSGGNRKLSEEEKVKIMIKKKMETERLQKKNDAVTQEQQLIRQIDDPNFWGWWNTLSNPEKTEIRTKLYNTNPSAFNKFQAKDDEQYAAKRNDRVEKERQEYEEWKKNDPYSQIGQNFLKFGNFVTETVPSTVKALANDVIENPTDYLKYIPGVGGVAQAVSNLAQGKEMKPSDWARIGTSLIGGPGGEALNQAVDTAETVGYGRHKGKQRGRGFFTGSSFGPRCGFRVKAGKVMF